MDHEESTYRDILKTAYQIYSEQEYQKKLKEIESKLSSITYVRSDLGFDNCGISYDNSANVSKAQLFRLWVIGESYDMPEGMTFGEIHAELDAIEQSINKVREKFSFDKFGNK